MNLDFFKVIYTSKGSVYNLEEFFKDSDGDVKNTHKHLLVYRHEGTKIEVRT